MLGQVLYAYERVLPMYLCPFSQREYQCIGWIDFEHTWTIGATATNASTVTAATTTTERK